MPEDDNLDVQLAAMLNCKVGPGSIDTGSICPSRRPFCATDFAAGASGMSHHRLKCRNSVCAFNGMMEAKSDQQFVKKAFLDKAMAKLKAKGAAATAAMMQVRCPKCGMRWKMRSDQLH